MWVKRPPGGWGREPRIKGNRLGWEDLLEAESFAGDGVAGPVVAVAVLQHEPQVGHELADRRVLAGLELVLDARQPHRPLDHLPC